MQKRQCGIIMQYMKLQACYDKLSETSEDIEQIAQFRQMAEDYKYQAEQWKLPDEIV